MSDPKKVYNELIKGITVWDLRRVARIMVNHVGADNAIRLDELALLVYEDAGEGAQRKVREVLETLIEEHSFPVCSHSGKAGRWLAESREEADAAALERESRAEKLRLSARNLRQAGLRLPARVPGFDSDRQRSLF